MNDLPQILDTLETPQDFENAFSTITEEEDQCKWMQADLILEFHKKFPGKHLDIYRSGQLMSSSTERYYLRTAIGFPPELRIPSISFSHHLIATYADKFDSKKGQIIGTKRFGYIEKAADEQWSTRQLRKIIEEEKEGFAKREEDIHPCVHCTNKENTFEYTIYKHGSRKKDTLWLHEDCYFDSLTEIIQHQGI